MGAMTLEVSLTQKLDQTRDLAYSLFFQIELTKCDVFEKTFR